MIKILDCTLRDGGYVNNWAFGLENSRAVISDLAHAGIDIIECGFVSQKKKIDINKTIFLKPSDIKAEKLNSEFSVMINYGEYNFDELEEANKNDVDIIRFAFHKKDYVDAIKQSEKIKKLGYKLFLQPMNTRNYSEEEYIDLIKRANAVKPYAFYVVDTFGNMRRKDVHTYMELLSAHLDKSVIIGFHSHNNLQLSFSNAQFLIAKYSEKDMIIDSCLLGMGRGAGNLCTELISQYLNEECGKKYKLLYALDAIDRYISPIKSIADWGYSIPYYLASINACHPNYATYLTFKQTLTIADINAIIESIPFEKKQIYDEAYIAEAYIAYQNRNHNEPKKYDELVKATQGKNIFIIGPGKSIATAHELINNLIKVENAVVISINTSFDYIKEDYVFVSNKRRFNLLKDKASLIVTSNIDYADGITVSYEKLLSKDSMVSDNAGLMAIKLLASCHPSKIYLAGFDGYVLDDSNNYYEKNHALKKDYETIAEFNKRMSNQIKHIKEETKVPLYFVTPSLYNSEEN